MRRSMLGPRHQQTLLVLNNLANVLKQMVRTVLMIVRMVHGAQGA